MNKPTDKRDKPAGGRGAIAGSVRAFAKQGIPVKLIGSFLQANKLPTAPIVRAAHSPTSGASRWSIAASRARR